MSCLKGESKVKKKEAEYVCKKCGAMAKKKQQVCKAVPLKKAKSGGSKAA